MMSAPPRLVRADAARGGAASAGRPALGARDVDGSPVVLVNGRCRGNTDDSLPRQPTLTTRFVGAHRGVVS